MGPRLDVVRRLFAVVLAVCAAGNLLAGANRVYNAAQFLAAGVTGELPRGLLLSGAHALIIATVAGLVAFVVAPRGRDRSRAAADAR